ncbi:hypothetical protein [Acinetobacter larvae]|uniref:Uncharacterized protein n=1 Tax=Acinetobacter larvae TaxID=1789224 RepID=A0A1B2LZS8_9GAMM|nr:hypothetical protein [Acinetobacter larvae]AOA58409.1 hypothetical protein BFG52_08610 [Acinetobacter larvae]
MYYLYASVSFYFALAVISICGVVYSAPLFNTDDAGIVDQGQCQIELDQAFYKQQQRAAHLTPACQLIHGVELALPVAYEDDLQQYAIAAKVPFLQTDYFAIAASVEWQPKQTDQERQWRFNIPLSWYASERWQFDVNIGQQRFADGHENTWAVASHYQFNALHQLSLEFFQNESQHRQSQLLYQYQAIPEKVALFTSFGVPIQNSHDSAWLGVGLSWLMAK